MRLRSVFRPLALCAFSVLAACSSPQPTPKQVFSSSPPPYNYPIRNPYAATVIGVPPDMKVDFSNLPPPSDRTVTVFKDRTIPEGFWYYRDGVHYSQLLQSKPAPLVYIVGGLGADNHAGTSITLADILYSAGFSVVILPSPTHANFIVSGSWRFLPGGPAEDAQDLYRVMQLIEPRIEKQTQVTGRLLAGYSLGAMDALYTAMLDNQQGAFKFRKVLLINPPLNLTSSMQVIDNLLYRDLPHGVSGADQFIKNTVQRFANTSQSSDALDFSNERLLLEAYQNYQLGDNRLATIIGISFRLAASNMIFTADVMGHDGYIFPKNQEFTTETSLNNYMAVALRTSFKDYFNQLYVPKYRAANPDPSAKELAAQGNMEEFSGYLSAHPEIGLVTNRDDIILAPGESDRLTRLFGTRAIVFPTGGHLGNLAHPAVAWRIAQFMKE